MVTNALSWVAYSTAWLFCRAVTIRLVPTSRPIGSLLDVSTCFILFFLFCAPVLEGGLRVFVSLLQNLSVFGHRHTALSRAFAPSLFGESEAFPKIGAGGINVSWVVIEPEQVECRVGYLVILRKSDLLKREAGSPIGVIADSQIFRIHGDLGMRDAVFRQQIVFAAEHLDQGFGSVKLRVVDGLLFRLGARFERHAYE